MYLWQRLAAKSWWETHEADLTATAGAQLAIIQPAERKSLTIEVASRSNRVVNDLRRRLGGNVVKLPPNWLGRFAATSRMKPLRIGKRLVITTVEATSVPRQSSRERLSQIVIPAGAAFGTGSHVTTAMSLR